MTSPMTEEREKLEPCPFCGSAMKVSPHPINQWAICPTDGCIGARQTIVLEDPHQVAAWNRRSTSASERGMREALEGMLALVEDMSRFVGQMALKDYALFNEAPIRARAALSPKGEG